MKSLGIFSVIVASTILGAVTAHAGDVILGETRLDRISRAGADTDFVDVPGKFCGISKVRIEAVDYDVRIENVILNFNDGGVKSREIIPFGSQLFDAPATSTWVDVPGRTRCVDSMVITGYTSEHRSRYARNIKGLVRVIGHHIPPAPAPVPAPMPPVVVRPTPPAPAPANNVNLGETRLAQLNPRNPVMDTDVIDVPGKFCGISKVRIEAVDHDVRIENVTLNFNDRGVRSNEVISFGGQLFDAPTTSTWIDVPGRTRCVDSMVIRGYTSEHRNRYTRNIQGLVRVIGHYLPPAPAPIPAPIPAPVQPPRPQHTELMRLETSERAPFTTTFAINEPGLSKIQVRIDERVLRNYSNRSVALTLTKVTVYFSDDKTPPQDLDLTPFMPGSRPILVTPMDPSPEFDLWGGDRAVAKVTIHGFFSDRHYGNDGLVPAVEIYGRKRIRY